MFISSFLNFSLCRLMGRVHKSTNSLYFKISMSTKNKIISFFLRHPEYFKSIVAASYSFSFDQLKKYQSFFEWRTISGNTQIKWDVRTLEAFSKNLEWDSISVNSSVFKDVSLVDQFEDRIRWERHPVASRATIASNTGLPWSEEFIKKYESKLFFEELTENESLPWTEQLINKYLDRWDLQSLSNNNGLPWSLSFFEKYLSYFLSFQFPFGINEAIYGIFEIVDKYYYLLDWYSIWSNPQLPWIDKKLLEYWEEHINWRYIACNEFLLKNPIFFEEHLDKWLDKNNHAFYTLSSNEAIPWTKELIQRFTGRWNWENLSRNEGLPWSIDFIDRYAHLLQWGGYEEHIKMEDLTVEQMNEHVPLGTYHTGLIANKALPWSIDFLLYYEDKIDEDMLSRNSAVWEKAFEPFVDEEVIEKVIRIL